MNRLTARGKFLYEGDRKFFARGVSYGPFKPNSRGERYPEPARVSADFALMRDLGANLVRTYVPPPPWMFELGARHGLRMMVGIPWPFHMAFLDSPQTMHDIRAAISDGVRSMRQFAEVIFAYSLGNEIRSDIVRWHGARAVSKFLRDLYDRGKQLDPEGLFTYSNYPSAEYLELGFLDFVSFNVYLHREADFRRYLTHLLALTRDRPLILSETGMDTIREGEQAQAEMLAWQARATFELGLCGFVIFAFTDEWHTGGAEITDWSFGLVTRDRQPKLAFSSIAEVFNSEVPPPLTDPPKVSVIVCAFNAAKTLGACLAALERLNYPDYEVIVVDDGSTDSTSTIAEDSGVRLVRIGHQGLAAARNVGISAAHGPIVAFIDADAEADPDWLYHLVEAIRQRDLPAAGGQNFPPHARSALHQAIASAPGEPREVRTARSDELAQLCGCSMALDRTRMPSAAPFDQSFVSAGDDVDFSWWLQERGERLGYAPGAVVIHRRRATVLGYLRQQSGYGRAEALLARKYPKRSRLGAGIYGASGLARWFNAGPQIYYGSFGRGLFQSVYRPEETLPLLQIPLSLPWLVISAALVVAGSIGSRGMLIVGLTGLASMLASAIFKAVVAELPGRRQNSIPVRALLALLCFLGPLARSFARDAPWRRPSLKIGDHPHSRPRVRKSGSFPLRVAGSPDQVIQALREALFARGAAVALGDSYDAYDLEVRAPSGITAALNLLGTDGSNLQLGWNLGFRLDVIALPHLSIFVALLILACGFFGDRIGVVAAIGGALAALFAAGVIRDSRRIPPLLELAAEDLDQARNAGANSAAAVKGAA